MISQKKTFLNKDKSHFAETVSDIGKKQTFAFKKVVFTLLTMKNIKLSNTKPYVFIIVDAVFEFTLKNVYLSNLRPNKRLLH